MALSWVTQPDEPEQYGDDTLTLMFLCCHPSLSHVSSIALTLRAVGGLTTAEMAEVMELSPATIEREWSFSRAWLYDALAGGAVGAAVSA